MCCLQIDKRKNDVLSEGRVHINDNVNIIIQNVSRHYFLFRFLITWNKNVVKRNLIKFHGIFPQCRRQNYLIFKAYLPQMTGNKMHRFGYDYEFKEDYISEMTAVQNEKR